MMSLSIPRESPMSADPLGRDLSGAVGTRCCSLTRCGDFGCALIRGDRCIPIIQNKSPERMNRLQFGHEFTQQDSRFTSVDHDVANFEQQSRWGTFNIAVVAHLQVLLRQKRYDEPFGDAGVDTHEEGRNCEHNERQKQQVKQSEPRSQHDRSDKHYAYDEGVSCKPMNLRRSTNYPVW